MLKKKLNILMLHNRYQQKGGEDISTLNEAQLLREGGHDVDLVEYDNHEINTIGPVKAGIRAIWSTPAVKDVEKRLSAKNYDIMHVQNYFPLISPAVLWAASKKGVATVQALRNYRLLCCNAQLFRDGKDCHDCIGSFAPWHGIQHKCYRGSLLGSATLTAMIATHKILGTWKNRTNAFITVSEYVRDMYIQGGFSQDRLFAKPNVVAQPSALNLQKKNQISYIGRLSPEKGVENLINSWNLAGSPGELVIAGSGPSENDLRKIAGSNNTIIFRGLVSSADASQIMAESKAIVIPSIWAEPFPRTGVEAFAVNTPVFGAASGGISELLKDNRGGALYSPNDVTGLGKLIERLFKDDIWAQQIIKEAQEVFKERYCPEVVLLRTEEIYKNALLNATSHNLV